MKILATDGPAGLTTTNVCDRLTVTRGSFYHHFADLGAFHEALIAHWETDLYARAKEAANDRDPVEKLAIFKELGIHAQHRAERAIRVWAYDNPMVAAAQRRADTARQASVAAALRDAGLDRDQADSMAAVGYALLVGTQVNDSLDRDQRTRIVNAYAAWVDHLLELIELT